MGQELHIPDWAQCSAKDISNTQINLADIMVKDLTNIITNAIIKAFNAISEK